VIWTPRPWQWYVWVIASVITAFVIALSYDGLRSMGICTHNLVRSLWAVGLSLVIGTAAVVFAMHMHTLHLPGNRTSAVRHFGLYVLWAMLQQLMLQYFFLARSLRLLSNASAAAALTAGLFAFAHLPNPLLTLITLFCGLAACYFFLHYRNLWPLVAAHAILGISIAITIPNALDHNMSVGIGYLNYSPHSVLSQTAMSAKP
jgi:membrane protease YdiL (CAAX protease family)